MNDLLRNTTIRRKRQKEKNNFPLIAPKSSRYIAFKYVLEYIVALIITITISPFLLFVGLLIKLDSKGDILFKHKRYGISGIPFYVYKFRTMVNGAHDLQSEYSYLNEMKGGKLFKSDDDPRVTKLGKFLRKTSIDELPQLFNILKGDMTIIGPRPISTPLDEYDEEDYPRFMVKSGLGCIWQAYFRKETDFKSWMKTDVQYVENISFKLDLKLFVAITKSVVLRKGAR